MYKNQFCQEVTLADFIYFFSKNYAQIIFLITLVSCSTSRNFITAQELEIPKDNYADNFLEIHSKIEQRYSHIKSKHIDMSSLEDKYLGRINDCFNINDYVLVLSEYFGNLKNSHSGLYLKPYIIKAKAKRVGNNIFVDKVIEAELIKAGISAFDEILAVNNTPTLQWLQKEENYISASTRQDMKERATRNIFKSNIGAKRTYTFKTDSDIKSVEVELKPYRPPAPYSMETVKRKVISDSIGYINIRTMTGDVKTSFENAYGILNAMPALIVDLRTNGGGDSSNSEYIVRYLLKDTIKACVSGKRLHPKNNPYKGKLYILTSAYTISAAESFLLDLKNNTDIVFIGSQTAGDTGNRAKIFTTSHGMSFKIPTRKPSQISLDGFPMEGKGITPDFEVQLTQEDYLNKVDTVLEFTLSKIIDSK